MCGARALALPTIKPRRFERAALDDRAHDPTNRRDHLHHKETAMRIIAQCHHCAWEKLAYTAAMAGKYSREHAIKHKKEETK